MHQTALNHKAHASFIAGTLVHTKDGLRPIESIQVGDYVLSKPDTGEGEVEYKRVTRTFEHQDQELYGVVYGIKGVGHLITTTAEHPFWVPSLDVDDPKKRWGSMNVPHNKWVTVQEMYQGLDTRNRGKKGYIEYYLTTIHGHEYPASRVAPICTATNNPKSNTSGYAGEEFGVLWSEGGKGYEGAMNGSAVDFRVTPPTDI